MDQLKSMKEMLTGCVQGQLTNLQQADYRELGAAVDMIKDLAEAIYYCTITEAMEEKEEKKEKEPKFYMMPPMMEYGRDMDRASGRMYYDGAYNYANGGSGGSGGGNSGGGGRGGNSGGGGGGNNARGGGSRGFSEMEYPFFEMRDSREGRSGSSRRNYMEAKEMHQGKEVKMKELEKYLKELSHDLTEMVEDASPEEKQMLRQKMTTLASKIDG